MKQLHDNPFPSGAQIAQRPGGRKGVRNDGRTVHTRLRGLGITVALLVATLPARGQTVNAADVLQAMHLANDWFIAQHPDPGAPTFVKKERPSNLWTRGVYFEGLSELNRIDARTANVAYMNAWAQFHRWTPRNGVTTRDADDYCCCQSYLDMYADSLAAGTAQDDYIAPTLRCMDNLLDPASADLTPATKARYSQVSVGDWTWIDAIQMGLPVLTSLSALTGSPEYAEQGWLMYTFTRDSLAGGLFNHDEGLWWRDADFCPPYTSPAGANCYWSRGNGWVYAALVRAMEDLGPEGTHYGDYLTDFRRMTDALLACQREDRFWNVDLLDSTDYGGPELTGTALFVYGMAWGVRHRILPAGRFWPVIQRTWQAMVGTCLHEDGFLGYVQGTGKEPKDSQPVGWDTVPDFDDFGLGCFLLAGSEVYRLAMDPPAVPIGRIMQAR